MKSIIPRVMQEKSLSKFAATIFALFLAIIFSAQSTPLFTNVPVSDFGWNNIGQANTSRNVAVAPDGNIYVVYSGSAGIRVAKSIDNGMTFGSSIQITTNSYEAEIEIAANGTIYVGWIEWDPNNWIYYLYMSFSYDNGSTYTSPTQVGQVSWSSGLHLASDGSYIYALEQGGSILYSNGSNGMGAFLQTTIDWGRAFSDIRVDNTTGIVYAMTDDPFLRLYQSTDNGISFSQTTVNPPGNIYYSSYTLSVGPLGKFMFVSGYLADAYKIDVTTGSSTYQSYGVNDWNSQARTLASDSYGNLIDGYYNSGWLKYRISFDQGTTWQPEVNVAPGYSHNVAINPFNHNILVVFEVNGQIYLNTYTKELKVPLYVANSNVYDITCKSGKIDGKVFNFGAGSVGTRGFVYSTSPNPTTNDGVVVSGTGEGYFSEIIPNLCPGTTYYVRAFAKNSFGEIFYGSDAMFTTLSPTLTITLDPAMLWPPNHKMKTINATVVNDLANCGGTISLYSVKSNEPDNGLGDGDKEDDIQNEAIGTSDYTFDLRAERSGTGTGRIYTVTYRISYDCGTYFDYSANVTVPHSMDKKGYYESDDSFISVYPNPANNFINIEMSFVYFANAKITITDILGNTINSFNFNNINSLQKEIDIQNLASGTYYVYITFGEEHFVKKIMKL